MLKIIVKNRKTLAEKAFQLKKNIIVVGRSKQSDVEIESDTVSRQHCQFHVGVNEILIEDLGSGNGTFVNNNLLPAKQKVALKTGDSIRIEDFILEWQTDKPMPEFQSDSPFDSTDPDILEMKMIKKVIGAMSTSKKPQLILTTPPFQHKSLTLDSDKTYVIGREPECDLSLDSPVMSRKHAQISSKWGTFVIEDLQSKNGTFVNGAQINQETSLKDKDKILFGTLEAVLHFPETYNFKEIESSLQNDKDAKAAKKLEESQSLSQRLVAKDKEPASQNIQTEIPKSEAAVADTKSKDTESKVKADEKKSELAKTEPVAEVKPDPAPLVNKPTPSKTKPALLKMLSGLSVVEWILFGFAIVVIAVVLFSLKALLS